MLKSRLLETIDGIWDSNVSTSRYCTVQPDSHQRSHTSSWNVTVMICFFSHKKFCLWDWWVDVQQLGEENTGVHRIHLCQSQSWAGGQRQTERPQNLTPRQVSTRVRLNRVSVSPVCLPGTQHPNSNLRYWTWWKFYRNVIKNVS